MDMLREFEELREVRLPRAVVGDRRNPLEYMNNLNFFDKFRFSKEAALYIFGLIEGDFSRIPYRGVYIPPILQFLGTLRFFATGSFQSVIGELFAISQPSMSRIVQRVSKMIASRQRDIITFPDREGCIVQQRKFRELGGIPGVIGAIDCTHVKINSPGGATAELYRNRKGFFSINVQAVCDSDLKFTNIIARWPGSVHDSRIFNNSRLCAQLENRDYQGILLGDSGYALRPYLLTPILNPQNAAERRYNYAHIRTRNTVERLFGVWKRRFPCLETGLRVKKETALVIIVATAVLHNVARTLNAHEFEFDDENDMGDDHDDNGDDALAADRHVNKLGVAVRNTIIQQHFNK